MEMLPRLILILCLTSQLLAQQSPTLTLDQAVALALKSNRQLQSSALDITKAEETTAEAKTARLPQFRSYILSGISLNPINFTVPRGTLGIYPGLGPLPSQDSDIRTPRRVTAFIYGTAAQPISQLFKVRLAINQSRLGEQAARENLRQQKQDTARQVRETYYQLVQTQSQITSGESTLKALDELAALTARRLAEEAVLKSDSLNVKAKVSQQRYQLLQLRDGMETLKESLNHLLGRDLGANFAVELQPLPSPEELDLTAARAKALEQRPEIRKARLQTAKAELDVRRQRAEYLPDFSAQISYLSLANVNLAPQNITTAGFLFEWQPWDWGQKRHRLQQLRIASQQANLTRDDAEQQVILDVNLKYRKLLEARALLDTQAANQETEKERLRVVMNRYEQKNALLADVLQQQAAATQADAQYNQALASFWTAKANFDRALGEE